MLMKYGAKFLYLSYFGITEICFTAVFTQNRIDVSWTLIKAFVSFFKSDII